jgi:hypothetical protein
MKETRSLVSTPTIIPTLESGLSHFSGPLFGSQQFEFEQSHFLDNIPKQFIICHVLLSFTPEGVVAVFPLPLLSKLHGSGSYHDGTLTR